MMRNRFFASLIDGCAVPRGCALSRLRFASGLHSLRSLGIAMLVPVAILAQAPKAAPKAASKAAPKAWTAPKTPWGDPDLQGTWTSDDYIGVPMQRPANLGSRQAPTDEEIAQRQA